MAFSRLASPIARLRSASRCATISFARRSARKSNAARADSALVKAFDATMKDPGFLAEAARTRIDVNPVSGKAIDELLAEVYATPKDVVRKANEAITK